MTRMTGICKQFFIFSCVYIYTLKCGYSGYRGYRSTADIDFCVTSRVFREVTGRYRMCNSTEMFQIARINFA